VLQRKSQWRIDFVNAENSTRPSPVQARSEPARHSAALPGLDEAAHLRAKARDDVRLRGKPIRRFGRVGDEVVELAGRIAGAGLDP